MNKRRKKTTLKSKRHGFCCAHGREKEPLVELDRQPPLAGETAARGCQRYQAMITFGQGTAGKGNRADMAAPLTPAYGHCIAAGPDSDRRPRYGRAATTTTKD
ncbi:hypothetical protein D917_09953 [Trichinella nativa]|uniref:Uncharacterized protein n=1 Tax=Trichinella nativa TaxID=6335 RepID=A0A1Y3EDE3_9BILA|nr:hypothetical protein D917_09953 [Trichinella nativa]